MIANAAPSHQQLQQEFERFFPELSARLRGHLRNRRHRDELVAEAVGLAWATFLSARTRGKSVAAGTLAYYAAKAVRAGRRLAGATSLDALSETTLSRQRNGPTVSLSNLPEGDMSSFFRTFADRRWRWPVVDIVATKLDWSAFVARSDPRDRTIVARRLEGHRHTDIAAELGVSVPAVSQRLRSLRQRWEAISAA